MHYAAAAINEDIRPVSLPSEDRKAYVFEKVCKYLLDNYYTH